MPTGFVQFIWISNGIHERKGKYELSGKNRFLHTSFSKKVGLNL